ncbi:MAG: elongation factor P maturation arginine rhamnosyltransferase EarP [Zoogloeaceae bacterium]|jgi:hypothetical protein|nr:elongation factor P maturation arginine rhamnosyltransferase EarP [Zoogloeaceae bacterium]
MRILCDLFCRVVDNLGDAGVCWRLARQLALEHGWQVRLWIDDLQPLAALRSGSHAQEGVEICLWPDNFPEVTPGQAVIEAFACELPSGFIAAMARQAKAPVWINLEYLSVEAWAANCHGLLSPHPSLPLVKYFFFPGFRAGTGGLLRESNRPPPPRQRSGPELRVSLFCYGNPALPNLLDCWAGGDEPMVCQVADGLPRRQVETWLGRAFPVGQQERAGNLQLIAASFVSQDDYDARLAACDLNLVRGEDSFVRAQWAEKPLVWQPYPQADAAHLVKLDAFLALWLAGLDKTTADAASAFWRAWNGTGTPSATWPAFRSALPALASHAKNWAQTIAGLGDLARNLVNFCRNRL